MKLLPTPVNRWTDDYSTSLTTCSGLVVALLGNAEHDNLIKIATSIIGVCLYTQPLWYDAN
jgi:hypothetical protein